MEKVQFFISHYHIWSVKIWNIAKPVEILLVEDNEGDVGLVEEVFQDAKIRNNLHVADDGEEAMLFLNKEGQYSRCSHVQT